MNTSGPLLAFDRASVRSYDADGRLHVALTNISKANVCQYMGYEIPGHEDLGLDPNKIYRLWRDPEELEKAAKSFNNMPLQLKHVHQKANDPQQDLIVGTVSAAVFVHPYLKASLCVWHEEGIAAIETGVMEQLSSSYHYKPVMTPGTTPDGEPYDGRMTAMAANHVALVEEGRAGPDVLVADSNPFTTRKQEIPAMKTTKLGKALMVALSAASPKIAQDSSLGALVGKADKKSFDQKAVSEKLVAMDADVDIGSLEGIIEAIMGVQEDPEPTVITSSDSEGAAGIMEFLKGKGLDADALETVSGMIAKLDDKPAAMDEEEVDKKADEKADKKVEAAMDSMRAELTKRFQDLEIAKAAVRPVVGDVIGMDSADSVYGFALTHLKVDHEGLSGPALAKMFKVASDKPASAPSPSLASDAATVKAIPGLERFR